jgi:hypothetical protein
MMGMNAPAICDVDNDPGIVEPDELRNKRLLFLSKRDRNHKFVNDCWGEKVVRMGEKSLYTGYSQVEVKETRENSVVMNESEDEKNRMFNMAIEKNG